MKFINWLLTKIKAAFVGKAQKKEIPPVEIKQEDKEVIISVGPAAAEILGLRGTFARPARKPRGRISSSVVLDPIALIKQSKPSGRKPTRAQRRAAKQ